MSKVVSRERCPSCALNGRDTGEDNLAVYDDGHKFCYSCKYYSKDNNKVKTMNVMLKVNKIKWKQNQ